MVNLTTGNGSTNELSEEEPQVLGTNKYPHIERFHRNWMRLQALFYGKLYRPTVRLRNHSTYSHIQRKCLNL
jgi:hypothetical protein